MADIQVSKALPPKSIYDKCVVRFGADFYKGAVFTVGHTIYAMHDISDDLYVHEATHSKQQEKIGSEKWWKLYFTDDKFRLEQEVEAYKNQWNWAVKNSPREYRRLLKSHIIRNMSSRLYGNIVNEEEAEQLIMK